MHETFVVHSDHHALHWMFTITEPSARLTRWQLILAEYSFSIAYKEGKDNHHADAMSRLLTGSPTTTNDDYDDIPAFSSEDEKKGNTSDTKSYDKND